MLRRLFSCEFTTGRRIGLLTVFMLGIFSAGAAPPVDGVEDLDARTIMARVKERTDDYLHLSKNYIHMVDFIIEKYGGDGAVQDRQDGTEQIFFYHGRRYMRTVKRDGKLLEGEAFDEEERKEVRFREQTNAAVASGDTSYVIENNRNLVSLADLVDRYFYELQGTDTWDGRPVYLIRYTPKPNLETEKRRDKVFNNLTGTIWVDAQEFRILKITGSLIDNVRFGLIAANLTLADVLYEQQKIAPDVWMPKRVEVRVDGSIFFFKKIRQYILISFYGFEPAKNTTPKKYRARYEGTAVRATPSAR